MNSYERRVLGSQSQKPEWCFDSKTEKEIYTMFREQYVLPELQYRVGKYFIDFAFPIARIAVEFDGPMHNTLNKIKKDHERLEYIVSQKWWLIVIRPIHNGFIVSINWPKDRDRTEMYRHNLESAVKYVSGHARKLTHLMLEERKYMKHLKEKHEYYKKLLKKSEEESRKEK